MKRSKMNYFDVYRLWNRESTIIDEYRVYNKKLGVHGTLFKVEKITKGMETYIIKFWKNTEIVTTQARYAPEIKRKAFIIYDRRIRAWLLLIFV